MKIMKNLDDAMKSTLLELFGPLLTAKRFTSTEVPKQDCDKYVKNWSAMFLKKPLVPSEALWHTFSYNHYVHYTGRQAIEVFDKTFMKSLIVFTTSSCEAIICESDVVQNMKYNELVCCLNKIDRSLDIFICQKNYRWTFVIPHEPDFGPYFAYSSH